MPEIRATWGPGWIAGMGAKLMEVENQADQAYAIARPMGVENNEATLVVKERTTQKGRETINGMTALGEMEQIEEREDFPSDDREPTYESQLNPVKFAKTVGLSEEAREDAEKDGVGDFLDASKAMKISYMTTVNRHKFSLFNYGFTAPASLPKTVNYYNDGVARYSASHPIAKPSSSTTTQSNTGTAVASDTNLETGLLAMRNQLDDRGMLGSWGGGAIAVIAPIELEKTFRVILKSDKKSGTGNNDMNVYNDGKYTLITTKWINSTTTSGSNTAWHLVDTLRSPLLYVNRKGYFTYDWTDPYNRDFNRSSECRFSVAWKEWKGTWGSTGAG